MSNLNISSGGKPIDTKAIQARELKPGVTLEQALEKTQDNGLDETFVEAGGKQYVIYSEDNVYLESKASISINGQDAKVLKRANEINSFGEGLAFVPRKGYNIAKSIISPILPANAATGLAIGGGLIAGALSRNAILPFSGSSTLSVLPSLIGTMGGLAGMVGGFCTGAAISDGFAPIGGTLVGSFAGAAAGIGTGHALMNMKPAQTTGIGIGLGAIAGVAMVTAHADQDSKSETARQVKAWATGVGSVGVGAASPEIIKLASKIYLSDAIIKGAKIAGTAAVFGGAMATFGLAAAGALKEAQPKTIDEIAN